MTTPILGSRVRDRLWGGKFTGIVVEIRSDRTTVCVRWDNTAVEDEVDTSDIEVLD